MRRGGFGLGFGKGWWLMAYILRVLKDGPVHGYEILERLVEDGLAWGSPGSAGGLYRQLRVMEQMGLVTSTWDVTGGGPAKRVYSITPYGMEYLYEVVNDMKALKREIDRFIDAFER